MYRQRAKWRNECGEVAVRLAQGDAMVAVPGIHYRLPCVFGDTPCEMEGCLHCKCFSSAEFVQRREVHGAARRAIVLPCYDHCGDTEITGSPYGTRSMTPSASSRRRVIVYPLLPMQWYVGPACGTPWVWQWGVDVDLDRWPLHAG